MGTLPCKFFRLPHGQCLTQERADNRNRPARRHPRVWSCPFLQFFFFFFVVGILSLMLLHYSAHPCELCFANDHVYRQEILKSVDFKTLYHGRPLPLFLPLRHLIICWECGGDSVYETVELISIYPYRTFARTQVWLMKTFVLMMISLLVQALLDSLPYIYIYIYIYIYNEKIERNRSVCGWLYIHIYNARLFIGIKLSVAIKWIYVNQNNCDIYILHFFPRGLVVESWDDAWVNRVSIPASGI